MVACLLWMQVVAGSSPVSLKCYGVCDVLVWACRFVAPEGRVQFPPYPPSSLARVVIGRACKALFHGFNSHRDVQKYRHIAQLVRATLWYGGDYRFKPCYAYFFLFQKTLYLESFLLNDIFISFQFFINFINQISNY